MINGIIPLYKERGMTSHDCVAKVRHILHMKKVGHSGTLDPNVDGVLPICVGYGTKVVDYLMASGKTYQGSITLGFSTTTEDLDGETVATKAIIKPFSNDQIEATLAKLTGEITQIPPMYSAVKVHGRKLYEYARAGETVERPARQITVSHFNQRQPATYDAAKQQQTIYFTVDCSKGTYVRTLAVDFGRILGVPAVMSDLTRLKSGGFKLADTIDLAHLTEAAEANDLAEVVRPIDIVFQDYPQVALTDRTWSLVQNGVFLRSDELNQATEAQLILTYQGAVKCLYGFDTDKQVYRPVKMFTNK